MNKTRLERVIKKMNSENVPQLLVSDPVAIYYLIGKEIDPGERLMVLYIHKNGTMKLVINELFPQKNDGTVEFVWYNDVQDGVEILSKHIEKDEIIGIDKVWRSGFLLRLQELLPEKKYVNSSLLIDAVRKIKDEDEKELMRKSSLINDEVIKELTASVKEGMTEIELSDIVKEIYKKHGITELSFEPITAFAHGAADPHHMPDNNVLKRGDCVLMDIGGMYKHYASDMTRTVFLGEPTERQREVYEVVKEAQARGIAAAKPGNRMCDVDSACRDYITEKGFGKYFTHRTGHSIGLETHEYGDVSQANQSIIEVGQCFSIEPGIYLLDEGIGVRIEDLVLITEDGCEVLNKASKDLIVLK